METHNLITPTIEDYLKTIYLLQGKDGAHLVDIAVRMSVTKPSVCHAVTQLVKKQLAEHRKFGPVRLTDKGIEAAERLLEKYNIVKQFYMRVLDLNEDAANAEACAIEHTVLDATLEKMTAML